MINEEFRNRMVAVNTKTLTDRRRLRNSLNSLALKPVKIARFLHRCDLCAGAIEVGISYRKSSTMRAHEPCFQAVNREVAC